MLNPDARQISYPSRFMKISFFRTDFTLICEYMFEFSFISTQTYIRIVLRAVKGCASVEQSCVHANCDRRQNLP